MSTKRYAKIKSFIRENYKFLLFIVACQIFFLFPLPFVIDAPGGLLPVSDRVQVEDGTSSQGSFNLAYVKEIQANISTYLVSLINKDWDLIKQEEVKYDHETMKDAETRSKLLLKQGQQNATIVAYTHAKKQVNLQDPHFYVAYLDESVKSDIQIGDELLEFNHQKITEYEEIAQKVEQTKLGEEVTLTIQREQEEKEITIPIQKIDGEKRLGLLLIPIYDLKTDPTIKFTFHDSESGSSGGLMTALEIYDRLIEEDLTKGKTIVGTGTIDAEGNVGEISGVKYKLKGAVKEKADLFFVPDGNNYEEAKKVAKEKGYEIELVPVKTFDDALEYLKNME